MNDEPKIETVIAGVHGTLLFAPIIKTQVDVSDFGLGWGDQRWLLVSYHYAKSGLPAAPPTIFSYS